MQRHDGLTIVVIVVVVFGDGDGDVILCYVMLRYIRVDIMVCYDKRIRIY